MKSINLSTVILFSWATAICSFAQISSSVTTPPSGQETQDVPSATTNSAAVNTSPLTTINGITYRNYTISAVEADAVVITFWGGTKRIPFSDLSEQDRSRFVSGQASTPAAPSDSFPAARPPNNSRIPNGFGKVRWGASISDIMNVYPNVRASSEDDSAYPGAKVGEAYFQNQDIQKITFTIGDKGLCAVSVDYNPQWLLRNYNFVNTFAQKYGKPDHQEFLSNDMSDGTKMSTMVQMWGTDDNGLLLMYAFHRQSGFISLNARYTDNTYRHSSSSSGVEWDF